MGQLRREERIPFSAKVAVSWVDKSGNNCAAAGECLDISVCGMKLRLKSPLEIRAYVALQCEKAGLRGHASVRHCVRDKMAYIAGLEFSSGMKASIAAALTAT